MSAPQATTSPDGVGYPGAERRQQNLRIAIRVMWALLAAVVVFVVLSAIFSGHGASSN
jgi:hypothetical protein